ncbi:MAG TPA: TlpA disulfide reductase family protein [Prolixibacteraceae bacterium]|nr:TlpA disulfide reductase family protein [Prolixibacteraceae bacterium]
MRKIVILFSVMLLLASCSKKEKYTISGTIADQAPATIYLQQRIDGDWKNIDSARMENGKFEMTGKVDFPDAYYLSKSDRDKLLLFVENCPVTVVADSTVIGNAQVTGGKEQELYNSFKETYNKQSDALYALYYKSKGESNPELKKTMEKQVDSLDQELTKYQEKFMFDHPSSSVAVYLLTQLQYGKSAEELEKLLSKLDVSLNKTIAYKAMVKRVEALKKVAIGQKTPDFVMNDPEGKPVAISSVYSKNNYTLIDFWASWCGPCRAENPNVVAAFQKFGSKGFGVFGVSLDQDKERWLKAISDDKLTWPHVSDLKGWGNEAAKEYSVNSIPANFLVDKSGIIIGANLRGEDLMKKLEELLK